MRPSQICSIVSVALLISIVQGCGGSSGSIVGGSTGANGGGGGGSSILFGGNSASVLATTFQVDVNSGRVTTLTPKGNLGGQTKAKPGMFTGNSIGFTSSVLSNDPLNTGLRSLQVSLYNNSDIPIGVDPKGNTTGVNILFGDFVNTTGVQNQEANTIVSTFAGTTLGFADGSVTTAKFGGVTGVAPGPNGAVYVADFSNNRIRQVNQGFVSTFAGNGTAADVDGAATASEFNGPYGIAVNPVDGSIIVCDFSGNKIRRVTSSGVVNTVAGTGTAGGANGAGNVATFTGPTDVTVASNGTIYVSEAISNRIRKITLTGSPNSSANYTVSTFAGSGTGGFLDGNGASAEFFRPYGLATDPNGDVYVADYENNAIRRIDPSANVVTIAGTGTESDLDGYGNAATFNHPFGVAYLNGAVFVSEGSGELIREVMPIPGAGGTSSGWLVETLAGTIGTTGDRNGSGNNATFNNLRYIAASQSDSLYVADYSNDQVRRINPSTGTFPIGTPTGSVGTSGDQVALSNPTGVVDSSDLGSGPYIYYPGSLDPGQFGSAQQWNFVIPNGVTSFQFQVLAEAPTNELLPIQSAVGAGSTLVDVRDLCGSPSQSGFQDGNATESRFSGDESIAVDGEGVLYVADEFNDAIRRVDQNGNVSTIAGVSLSGAGYLDGPGNTAQFRHPDGITVNQSGSELLVTDSGNDVIRAIELSGGDPTNPSDWTVSTIAGVASTSAHKDGAGTVANFQNLSGIAVSPSGIVYVSDFLYIRKLNYEGGPRSSASDWQVSTYAGNGSEGFVNGQGSLAEFEQIAGICCDSYGNLYVCDPSNDAIREVNTSDTVLTFAGGTAGYQDGPGFNAEFQAPSGICCDSAGYLYVADSNNNLIRRVSPSGSVTTVAGQVGVNGNGSGPGNESTFSSPFRTAISASGNLYVASVSGASIRLIQTVIGSAASRARPR